jgi:hypothetical protein
LLLAPAATHLGAQEATGVATVYLADGSTVPLRNWSLSYEFTVRGKTTPMAQARSESQRSQELWSDKDVYPLAGSRLQLLYKKQSQFVDKIAYQGQDKKKDFKPKPPHRDRLLPDADGDLLVVPQSLDLKGETLTGTKRSFCVLSYTVLVVCFSEPSQQVVKVEFQ